ncbi:MAG: hypothetical protein IPL21_16035 [Saprospirales bacterium]|nr:hypothetical protein [Saprospirales bacterium]
MKILFIIEQVKRCNIITKKIKEPIQYGLICKSERKYIFFYIEKGKHKINIDLDNNIIYSKTSKLNQEFAEIWEIKKHYDILFEKAAMNQKQDIFTGSSPIMDSLEYAYEKDYYNWCVKHPKSFISLEYCLSLAGDWQATKFNNNEINILFNLLDLKLKEYPTYAKCKYFMDDYVNSKTIINKDDTTNILKVHCNWF